MAILEVALKNGFNEARLGEQLSVWSVRSGNEIWILWHEPAKDGFERGMCRFRGTLHWFETIERRRVGFDNSGDPLITRINVVVSIPEEEQEESERRHEIYRARDDPREFEEQIAGLRRQDFSKGHIEAWWGESEFYEDDLAAQSKRIDDSLMG